VTRAAPRTQNGLGADPDNLETIMFKYSEINMNFEVTLYCAE